MSAIVVVVRPRPSSAPDPALAPLHGLFDVLVDGINVTARVGEGQALTVLGELGLAVAALGSGRRDRATLPLYSEDEVWELGLEAAGDDVLITVFRSGPAPEVAVHERRVGFAELRAGVIAALEEAPARKVPAGARAQLELARRTLAASSVIRRVAAERAPIEIAPRVARGFGFFARAAFRQPPITSADQRDSELERADLHALLVRGEVGISVRRRTFSLGPSFPFLLAERLAALAEDVLDALQTGRPLFRRIELAGSRVGVRRDQPDGPLAVSVRAANAAPDSPPLTFPAIEPLVFVQAVIRFCRALADGFQRTDPSQLRNLRLGALSTAASALWDRIEDGRTLDSLTNPEPDSYRSLPPPQRKSEAVGRWEHGGKMRFLPRWVATVPNIDLGATFLCGDRLLIGSARETACIERASGGLLWRMPTSRAVSLVTPSGLARLHPDGRVALHGLENGQIRFTTEITPRARSGMSGAVVHGVGLPKLLVLSEGERQLTAIDLVSGEVRWRHTARRAASFRVRRAGRLLLVASSDFCLFALDAATGEVVWRLRERHPFTGDVSVSHDSALAISGAPGSATLHHIDPWSGEQRWSAPLEDRPLPGQPPLLSSPAVVVAVRDRRGAGLRAFARDSGEELWAHEPGFSAPTSAFLAVDDAIVVNSAAGTLSSVEAATGALRFSHVFPRHVDADHPRRVEPVLRSGALFVPQFHVHVVRPRDGEIIGSVPTDLIPDLLRVDERCDVYVAEESGHVAAFGVAPKLTLVK
jgi:outer membrane protein assembly factor BamB